MTSEAEISVTTKTNRSVQHFTGEDIQKHDQRKYEEWYTQDTLKYLTNAYIPATAIGYIFLNQEVETKKLSFANQFQHLVAYAKQQEPGKSVCFIAFEPAKFSTAHFIFGILAGDVLLFVNPLGINRKDFYEYLHELDIPRFLPNIKLCVSNTVIQKDEAAVVSCGPLCVEILKHFVNMDAKQLCLEVERNANPTTLHNLSFLQIDITNMLPASLQLLTKLQKGDAQLKLEIEKIRADHLEKLRTLSTGQCEGYQNTAIQKHITEVIIKEQEEEEAKQPVKSNREQLNKALEYILITLEAIVFDILQNQKEQILLRLELIGKAFLYLQEAYPEEFSFAEQNKLQSSIANIRINLKSDENKAIDNLFKQSYELFLNIAQHRDSVNSETINKNIEKIRQRFPKLLEFDIGQWSISQLKKFKPILPENRTETMQQTAERLPVTHVGVTGGSTASTAETSEILIPADGDCLYTSIFFGYLLPVIHDHTQFVARLTSLIGQALSDSESFRLSLSRNFTQIEYLKNTDIKLLVKLFKKNMGLYGNLWGGRDEIRILSQRLNIVIQELIENPSKSATEPHYIAFDEVPNPNRLETITVLKDNARMEEAVQRTADLPLQVGQAVSALTSSNLQHYRLVAPKQLLLKKATTVLAKSPPTPKPSSTTPVIPVPRSVTPTPSEPPRSPAMKRAASKLSLSSSSDDQLSGKGKGARRSTINDVTGIQYNLGISQNVYMSLYKMGAVGLIPKLLEVMLSAAKLNELKPEIFNKVIDTAASTLESVKNKEFEQVKLLLEKDLVKHFDEINKFIGIQIRVFDDNNSHATSISLATVLEHLKSCQLTYVKNTTDQDLYTPLDGYYDTASIQPERFPLYEKMILPFLKNKEMGAVLIVGEAGSGKTKFLEYITQFLLENSKSEGLSIVPIYIKLIDPNIKDVDNHLLEDTLLGYGLNSHEVDLLLSSNEVEFCFLFDGVEELIRKNKAHKDFYHTNKIYEKFPSSHSIFTGRISGLPVGYEALFEPLRPDGNRFTVTRQAKTINVAPFDVTSKKQYIQKFILNRDISKKFGYTNHEDIYKRIASVPNLLEISGRPILMMMTMTVLPYLEALYKKENKFWPIEVIQKDLFHMYTNDMFERAKIKILQRHNITQVGKKGIYDCILEYSILLARLMCTDGHSVTEVSEDQIFIDDDDFAEFNSNSPHNFTQKQLDGFKKAFGASFDTKLYKNAEEYDKYRYGREGCDLLNPKGMPGHLMYKFIHDDFVDYFAFLTPQSINGRRTIIKKFMDEYNKTLISDKASQVSVQDSILSDADRKQLESQSQISSKSNLPQTKPDDAKEPRPSRETIMDQPHATTVPTRLATTDNVRGQDDEITDQFFAKLAGNYNAQEIKQKLKIEFIVVCHIVPTLPYYLRALEHFGGIACLIPKGFGAEANRDPTVFSQISKSYPMMPDVTRITLSSEDTLNDFLVNRIKYNAESNKATRYIIIDEGGYFTNHPLPEAFNQKLIGIVETTENGHQRYDKKIDQVKVNLYSIARTHLKAAEDAYVGKSIVYATEAELRSGTNTMIERFKKVGVMGYGKIGKSTASTLLNNMQVKPIIFEPNPLRAVEAGQFQVAENKNKSGNGIPPDYDLSDYDLLFCTTGVGAIRGDTFKKLKDNVFLASCTSCEDEFRLEWLNNPANATVENQGNFTVYTVKETNRRINFVNHGNSANFLYNAVEGPSIYLVFASTILSVLNLIKLNNTSQLNLGKIHELTSDEQAALANIWLNHYLTTDSRTNQPATLEVADAAKLPALVNRVVEKETERLVSHVTQLPVEQPSAGTIRVYKTRRNFTAVPINTGIAFEDVKELVKTPADLSALALGLARATNELLAGTKSEDIVKAALEETSKVLEKTVAATHAQQRAILAADPGRNVEDEITWVGMPMTIFANKSREEIIKKLAEDAKKDKSSDSQDAKQTGPKPGS